MSNEFQHSSVRRGVYYKCPVCDKNFYVGLGIDWSWLVKYRTPCCSYTCMRKWYKDNERN